MKYYDQYQGMEVSFWEIFPVFLDVDPFRKLYKEDRSDSKNKSSKVMWYMVLAKDIDSEFYNLDPSEQEEVLMDIAGFDIYTYLAKKSNKLPALMLDFELFIDTPLSADVRALEAKLKERALFIRTTKYTLDKMEYPQREGDDGKLENVPGSKPFMIKGTAPQLDKMVVETMKVHDEVRKLRDALSSEVIEQGKGGQTASFLEST